MVDAAGDAEEEASVAIMIHDTTTANVTSLLHAV
jgi:hypothetical protein